MQLAVKNLKKSFGEKVVLDDVSFTCQAGIATGLLGRNGAGKTTSIRTILGIINKDGGEVFLDGRPIPRYYQSIGYLPEERGLYPKIKVCDQLMYFAKLHEMSVAEGKKALNYWLDRLEMREYEHKRFETLSKGNQQKIQLMLALIHNPRLIILDEPFSGLDPVNAQILKDVVMDLIQQDKLVIFSSHQMNFVEEFCQEIVLLHNGKIVANDSIKNIKKSYERRKLFVRLRNNQTNLLQAIDRGYLKAEPYEDGYIFTLAKEDDCQTILQIISQKGLDIDQFNVMEHSLNDIFILKVGDEE